MAQSRPAAMTTLCTNLRAEQLADEMERELGIPIYDSVATVVWKALQTIGVDTRLVRGWRRLFEEHA